MNIKGEDIVQLYSKPLHEENDEKGVCTNLSTRQNIPINNQNKISNKEEHKLPKDSIDKKFTGARKRYSSR